MFRLLFRRFAPFPLVLGRSYPLVGVDAESSEVVQETPHPLFFLPPLHSPRPPPILRTLRTSAVSYPRAPQIPRTRFASCVKPRRCSYFTSDKRVQIGNRVVGAIVLSPTDAASQDAVVGSAQRVVVSRARAPRDAAVQHCLEYLGS